MNRHRRTTDKVITTDSRNDPNSVDLVKAVQQVHAALNKQGKVLGCLFIAEIEGNGHGILFGSPHALPDVQLAMLSDLKQAIKTIEEYLKGKKLQ